MARNKNDLENIEEHLKRLTRAQGSTSPVSVKEVSGIPSVSACIDLSNYHITQEIPSNWDPLKYKSIEEFVNKLKIKTPKTKICEDIQFHEIGHHKLKNDKDGLGCPEDLESKEITIEAVSKALLEKNKFSQQGALYLENCISDIINNLNGSQYTHFNGLSMFWAEQGELNKGKFSPLYEAFVKLNQKMWGRKPQRKLLSQYHTNEKKVDEIVELCLKDNNIVNNKQQNINNLFNKSNWDNTFYKFAIHLAELMDQDAPEQLPGSGSDGRGYKVPIEFDGEGKFNPEEINDPMVKRILDPDNMKKVMQRRNQKGEDLPMFVENWRALDYFYQGLASELYIKAESPKKGQSMPIAPIQSRKFDIDKDKLENILFGKILLDEEGKPSLAVPRDYVRHVVKYKQSIKSYPELNICVLDTSGSMIQEANSKGEGKTNIVPWGDNSKYHYALLSYYGVEKALHRIGVGIKTRYNMITFASQTDATGEKGYEDKVQIKKRILNPVFGGSTSLDVDVLAKNARESGSILMTISDGEIWNWDSVKNDFKRIISDKHYVHFQIGSDTKTTKDLESYGATVIRINDASEMPKKAIDITKGFYKNYAQGELR